MNIDITGMPVYIQPGFIDGRKGLNGLLGVVKDKMKMDVGGGALYVFCMRRRDTLKCICYDGTGFWFVQKRLVGYKFPWPEGVEEAKGLAGEDFLLLLQGVDFFHKFEKWDSIKIS